MMTQKELDEMLSRILEEHRAGVRAAFEAGKRAGAEEREACVPSDLGASLQTAIGAVVKPGSRVSLSVRQPDGSFVELVFTTSLPRST